MNIVLKKILGDPQAKTVKRLRKRVKTINALNTLSDCTDKFVEYSFYFKRVEKGVEQYAVLTTYVEAGKKKVYHTG